MANGTMLFIHTDRSCKCYLLTRSNQCQRRLTEQQITSREPGTILKDVNTVLEFVGPDGIVNKSRNASFPPERLQELNAKVGHPIQLDLKRALLRDYQTVVRLIAGTTTAKGLTVTCRLDRRSYTPGRKVTEEEMANINIQPSRFHGEWNYVIHPHR